MSLIHPDWHRILCCRIKSTKQNKNFLLACLPWILSSWLKPEMFTGDIFFLREKLGRVGSWEWEAGSRVFLKAPVIKVNIPVDKPAGRKEKTSWGSTACIWVLCSCHLTSGTQEWREVWSETSLSLALSRSNWLPGYHTNQCRVVTGAIDTPCDLLKIFYPTPPSELSVVSP